MNVPHVVENISEYIEEISEYRLLRVKSGSFVGCFVNLEIVTQVGLPISSFFIYGDDAEFTRRISKIKPAYLDYDSLIIHKAPSKVGADIVFAPSDRIDRYYFQHRNGLYIARKKSLANVITRLKIHGQRIVGVLFRSPDHKAKRIWVIIKGTWSGFWYNPKIEFPEKSKS
jgi:GT2 family glycosyltransferase